MNLKVKIYYIGGETGCVYYYNDIALTSADLLLVSSMTSYDTYSNIIHNSVWPNFRYKKKKKNAIILIAVLIITIYIQTSVSDALTSRGLSYHTSNMSPVCILFKLFLLPRQAKLLIAKWSMSYGQSHSCITITVSVLVTDSFIFCVCLCHCMCLYASHHGLIHDHKYHVEVGWSITAVSVTL